MIKIILLIVILIVLILLAAGYALFLAGIVRFERKEKQIGSFVPEEYAQMCADGVRWFKEQEKERIRISSYDGLTLTGLFLPAEGEAKGTIILFHGYRMDGYSDFSCVYELYHRLGYNLLNVFQRAHGESEGRYITFGIKERFDARYWAVYTADRFGPEHDIFLGGLSMGGSTVLMSTGTQLPENVRGVIADCGFTSPYDEFVHVLKSKLHLPVHPFIDIAEGFAQLLAGFGFKDYSTLEAMEVNTLPILFIHGEDDKLVPLKHTTDAFAACRSDKYLITVPKAGHGLSYLLNQEGCRTALEEFLGKYSTVR